MNIVYTFQIQDGERQRYEYRTEKLVDTATQTEINAKGEELLREEYTGDADGDWYWCSYYETMGRYYSYKVIPCDESFEKIKQILG